MSDDCAETWGYTGYVTPVEPWTESFTSSGTYNIEAVPQSFMEGVADMKDGQTAPLFVVLRLPAWVARLVFWFRKHKRG